MKTEIMFIALIITTMVSTGKDIDDVKIIPKEKAQSLIAKLVPPITEEDKKTFWENGKKTMDAYFTELREACGGRNEDVVLQLMYFSLRSKSMEQGMVAGFIIEQMKISKPEITTALLPLLETQDKTLQGKVYNWLGGTDKTEDGQFDFSCYESFLREKKQSPPQGLIRYMFDRNPQAAVVTVARVYGNDVPESEVAAKAKSGVKESVDYFTGRSEWWAHLYVATMMEKEPYLRTPEMIKKLEQDTDPLVREKVTKLKEMMQPN